MTACCECKTCSTIDKVGDKSWDCWAPEAGCGHWSPVLTTFQVLQDKTHSISMKPELWSAHRLVMISVCPVIISRILNCKFKSLTHRAWGLFPTGTPDVLCYCASLCCLSRTLVKTYFGDVSSAVSISLVMLASWKYGEGNGTPLQYSCLENPMDGGAW